MAMELGITQTVARDESTAATITQLQEHVTRLTAEADQLRAEVSQTVDEMNRRSEKYAAEDEQLRAALASESRLLRERARMHAADIALIGEKLIDEANDRGWCSEYDDIVNELNQSLSVELPTRMRDFTVDVTITVSISVSAPDESEAESMAASAARDIESTIDRGSWGGECLSATSHVDMDFRTEES